MNDLRASGSDNCWGGSSDGARAATWTDSGPPTAAFNEVDIRGIEKIDVRRDRGLTKDQGDQREDQNWRRRLTEED